MAGNPFVTPERWALLWQHQERRLAAMERNREAQHKDNQAFLRMILERTDRSDA